MNEKRHYLLVSESISTCASFLVQSRRDKGAAENFRTLIIRLSVRLARRDGVADSPALVTGVRGADPEHGAAPVVPAKRGGASRPAARRHARCRCARAIPHRLIRVPSLLLGIVEPPILSWWCHTNVVVSFRIRLWLTP
jgi:hypothetical protein